MQQAETRQPINQINGYQKLRFQNLAALQGMTHSACLFSQICQTIAACSSRIHLHFRFTQKAIKEIEVACVPRFKVDYTMMFKRLLLEWLLLNLITSNQLSTKKKEILKILSKAEMTEYEIATSIGVWKDTAFHLLQQLERSGLVEWQSIKSAGGDRRRIYRLTEERQREVKRSE